MFNIRIVQANFGDCFILEYGSENDRKFALIDGGPEDVYGDHLRREIERISGINANLDFLAVSHVDGDHITGVLDLFSQLEEQSAAGEDPFINISSLWHNSFSHTIDDGHGIQARFANAIEASGNFEMMQSQAAVQGIWQGNQLRLKATQLGIPINPEFPDNLVITETAPDPLTFGNLTLRIVGPSRSNLDELRAEWERWLDDNEPAIASGDPVAMSNSDGSLPNLSSLMFYIEVDGKTALFTGDGRSDHLLQGLKSAGLLDAEGRCHIDVLKVMHHASNRNVTRSFFKAVSADTYIISANGHPDNPDLSTLIWIVESAHEQGREISIIATNETRATRKLRSEYDEGEYGYVIDVMPQRWHYKELELVE